MSLARTISRGAFLNARFGVNGTKNASRSFGTVVATCRGATDIRILLKTRVASAYTSEGAGAEWRAHGCPSQSRPRLSAGVLVGRQDGRLRREDTHGIAREAGVHKL